MTRLLSTTFRSLKPHNPKSLPISSKSTPSSSVSFQSESNLNINWSVYLILSTNPPIKTYVGVTNNFTRRLKQHNGEINGGAKATQAGRPWICACIVRGFESKSEACKFEFKWKSVSSKMTRKKNSKDDSGLHLLQHRNAALQKVKGSIDCINLEFDWKLELL
ncbi:structure-specific endonuclease subunit slx1-like [Bidens hawaiensis]|uniref:structure-specific endonuclease subunit slx1-like n=1 Tax=Bidens hawaiensis TaxID=980011 RepID=UPI00404B055F